MPLMNYMSFGFELIGGKWGGSQDFPSSGGVVTYSFATQNFSNQFDAFTGFITYTVFQNEITESFSAWSLVSDIQFSLVSDASAVDIRLGWAIFDGAGGTLGAATIPSSGALNRVGSDAGESIILR